MSKVFKGKFIYYLKQAYHKGELNFPGELEYLSDFRMFDYFLNDIAFKKWNVYTKRPFAGPRQVLEYIGRYTHRVAISNHRLLSVNNDFIRFTYKNYKDESKKKIMRLTAEEFIRRFFLHILPHGFKKIRFFGFLSSGKRTKKIFMVRELLAERIQKIPPYFQFLLKEILRYFRFIMNLCPSCNEGSLVICEVIAPQFRRIYFDSS